MRLKNFFVFFILSAISVVSFAVPAMRGIKKQITLADGTVVMATLTGDEHMHYYLTETGQAVKEIEGAYRIVSIDSLMQVRYQKLEKANSARKARVKKAKTSFIGKKKGLVILANFQDHKFSTTRSEWNDYFNKIGYDHEGMGGSVREYFLEQSYGLFDLSFDVVGPYLANFKEEYYTMNEDNNVGILVQEMCKQADKDPDVDFSQYDWDGDGYVDQVYIVYAGYGEDQGAKNTIWSHEFRLSSNASVMFKTYETEDGVKVDTYACSHELHGDGVNNTGRIEGIGTACHEFTHCLGLPDFYDTSASGSMSAGSRGMDVWSLLDYGCYNGNYGYVPCGYTAYERMFAGWLEPIELTESVKISDMPCITDSPTAYIIYNQANRNEYYLLANHQKKGFDSHIYGTGLMMLHVDYDELAWKKNQVNYIASRPRMSVVPADNKYGTRGQDANGDLFPGSTNNTEFTNNSAPFAKVYNENTDGTYYLNAPITNIDETDGLITFDFKGGLFIPAPEVKAAKDINLKDYTFTASWNEVPGATKYTVSLQKETETSAWENVMFIEDFSGFYDRFGGTSREISGKLDELTAQPGWQGSHVYKSQYLLRVGDDTNDGSIMTPVIKGPASESFTIIVAFSGVKQSTSAILYFMAANGSTILQGMNLAGAPSAMASGADKYTYFGYTIPSWLSGDFRLKLIPKSGSDNIYVGYIGCFNGEHDWQDIVQDIKNNRKKTRGTVIVREDLGAFSTTETSYTFTNLTPGLYTYKVRATTADGNGLWSDKIEVDMVNGTTGVDALLPMAPITTNAYFDLSGRKVNVPSRGLYIKDGKKFMVK